MSYTLCFICSEPIEGSFENGSGNEITTAGTLCELLQLPIRESTLTFGQKFQQAPYCTNCVKEMTEMRELLSNLKELDKRIKQKRHQVESRLRKSCQSRRLSGENSSDEEIDDEESFHPFDYFREDVVNEIDCIRRSGYVFADTESESTTDKEIPGPIKTLPVRLARKQNLSGICSPRALVTMNERQATITGGQRDSVHLMMGPENVIKVEHDDFDDPEEVNEAEDSGTDLFTDGFNSMLSETSHVHVEIQEEESATVDINDGPEQKFEIPTLDGPLQCPYSPMCETLFDTTDRNEFINHIRTVHRGIPSQPGPASKRPRSGYEMQFKLDAVNFAESHGNAAAARHFCVDSKRIRDWKKQKSSLEEALDQTTKAPKNLRRRLPGAGRKPTTITHSN